MAFFDFVRQDAVVLARTLVNLALVPCTLALCFELVTAGAELGDGLLSQQLLKSPFFNILLLVLLKLGYELYGALEDRALVLLAAWNNLGEFVDAFVDSLATAALNCVQVSRRILQAREKEVNTPSL